MIEAHPIASVSSTLTHSGENVQRVLQAVAMAASQAPSGDNLQPWAFRIDGEHRCLEIWLEERVDSSSLNSGQRMSRIACGAAIESAVCAAADHGWSTQVSLSDDAQPRERRRVARIVLSEYNDVPRDGSMQRLIAARTTNRRLYDGQPVSPDKLAELQRATPPLDGSCAHWITATDWINAFARLAARADAMLFGEASMRRAFLKNVRFDLPLRAQAERGLPLGALEVSFFERLTLRSLPFTPDYLFKFTPAPWMFARYSKKLIRSSSGLCVITVDGSAHHELRAGRAMLRAWL